MFATCIKKIQDLKNEILSAQDKDGIIELIEYILDPRVLNHSYESGTQRQILIPFWQLSRFSHFWLVSAAVQGFHISSLLTWKEIES